jgi:hypothetical protein
VNQREVERHRGIHRGREEEDSSIDQRGLDQHRRVDWHRGLEYRGLDHELGKDEDRVLPEHCAISVSMGHWLLELKKIAAPSSS